MRPITTEGYAALETPKSFGPAGQLAWIPIAQLVVDPDYQREIVGPGRTNVRKIAEGFDWSKFAPVIVSPLEGGRYAIVDGQHRTTAAALCGIEQVPACVILVDKLGQAAAFAAVNGAVTKMSSTAMYHAAVLAGDPEALAIKDLCDRANVEVSRRSSRRGALKPNETQSPAALARLLQRYGRDTLVTALQCITETNQGTGLLSGSVIGAIADVLTANPRWRDAGGRLLDAFDAIDLEELRGQALQAAAQKPGTTTALHLANRLTTVLSERLEGGAA